MSLKLHHGDCLNILTKLDSNYADSLITDPPAGISFMGKGWDDDKGGRKQWIAWMSSVMQECLRVLKPGAHGLVWAIPRTSHWTATALEDAGFEIRDVVTHLFGTGFPKSLDISKAIDKAAGAEREVIGQKISPDGVEYSKRRPPQNEKQWNDYSATKYDNNITAPSTPEAKQWQGWGTALKPASENWILVRKPCEEDTVAKNVLKYGTGGINIDASRAGLEGYGAGGGFKVGSGKNQGGLNVNYGGGKINSIPTGRFPANLLLSHNEDCEEIFDQVRFISRCTAGCAVAALDAQSGVLKTGASRFFYCAKASKKDKEAGLDSLTSKKAGIGDDRPSGQSMQRLDGRKDRIVKNTHPTVKSTTLMTYLITLITPPNGVVLDPFMGSGSTGVAAKSANFKFIGIERDSDYFGIAKKRIFHKFPSFDKQYCR